MANLGDMVVRIVGDVTSFNKAIESSEKKFSNATSSFTKLGKGLSTFVTLPILGLGAAAIKSAADMEMLSAEFTTLLGNGEKAESMLSELAETAAKTPFELTDLAQASKTMLAFGISSEKVIPNLKILGDIAGGNSEKLRSLTLAFSQIQSTGRLMGQDLLQLVNAGFNPLKIISDKTGESMAVLKKKMEQGAISAEMVSEAFTVATSEGGLFFRGMERASETFSGKLSTLKDDAAALARGFGEILLPALHDILQTVSGFIQRINQLNNSTKKSIINFGLIAAAVGPAILALVKTAQAFNTLKTVISTFNLTKLSPIGLAIAAIGALIAAASAIGSAMKKAKVETENYNKAVRGVADTEELLSAMAKQRALIEEIENALAYSGSNKEAIEFNKKRLADARALLSTFQAQYNGLKYNLKVEQDLARAESERAATEAENDAEQYRTILTNTDAALSGISSIEDAQEASRLAREQIGDAESAAISEANQAELRALEEREAKRKADHEAELERIEEEKQRRLEAGQYIYGQIGNLVDTLYGNEEERIKQSSLSEEAKAKKIAQLKRKQASWDKAQAVVDIAIQTSLAVVKALPNIVLSGIIAALGAAQAAAVLAQPLPPVPLATGGIVMPQEGGTLAQIAEAGQPEVVFPLDKLEQFMGSMGNTHLVVNLDSRPILDTIFPATRDGTVLIDARAVVA